MSALRRFLVTDGQNTHDQITRCRRSKWVRSNCVLCMQSMWHMHNNNLEIRKTVLFLLCFFLPLKSRSFFLFPDTRLLSLKYGIFYFTIYTFNAKSSLVPLSLWSYLEIYFIIPCLLYIVSQSRGLLQMLCTCTSHDAIHSNVLIHLCGAFKVLFSFNLFFYFSYSNFYLSPLIIYFISTD